MTQQMQLKIYQHDYWIGKINDQDAFKHEIISYIIKVLDHLAAHDQSKVPRCQMGKLVRTLGGLLD